jgi:hypothetical protein
MHNLQILSILETQITTFDNLNARMTFRLHPGIRARTADQCAELLNRHCIVIEKTDATPTVVEAAKLTAMKVMNP